MYATVAGYVSDPRLFISVLHAGHRVLPIRQQLMTLSSLALRLENERTNMQTFAMLFFYYSKLEKYESTNF